MSRPAISAVLAAVVLAVGLVLGVTLWPEGEKPEAEVAALQAEPEEAPAEPAEAAPEEPGYEILVIGSVDEAIEYWKQRGFWGPEEHGKALVVPRVFIVATNLSWKNEAKSIPVEVKKELFYRSAVPLIIYANELIARDRERLLPLAERLGKGESIGAEETAWLRDLAERYDMFDPDDEEAEIPTDEELHAMCDELLVRVDIIPPALALGQAAYESGYGTSRFALEGNAYFGQWTWEGKGIRPKHQRKGKGDYKVAAYDWPLDSVRSYMRNLNTQRTYAQLRKIRAELRAKGEAITGHALAAGLSKYSEQGQKYVSTLRGMMKKNELFIADNARLRDEPAVLVVEAENPEDKIAIEKEIEALRASGELAEIIQSMRLDEVR